LTLNACILVKTKPASSDDVLAQLKRLRGVRKAYVAYGRYDIVVFVEGSDYPALRELTANINSIDGVRSTETLAEA
jgi:DNA-binding Lrp family transcriptional regulator